MCHFLDVVSMNANDPAKSFVCTCPHHMRGFSLQIRAGSWNNERLTVSFPQSMGSNMGVTAGGAIVKAP